MAKGTFDDLFRSLRADLDRLRQEIEEKQREHEELEAALRVLESRIESTESKFEGATLMEAARACLESAGRPLRTPELREAMEAGGWSTKSKDPNAIVYQTLFHHAKSPEKGGVRKVGKRWALIKRNDE